MRGPQRGRPTRERTPRRPHLFIALALGLAATLGAADANAVGNPMVQNLMKRLDGFATRGQLAEVSEILRVVKLMGPDEYKNWEALAERGRAAAAANDAAAVKKACANCHDQYRSSFKSKYGSAAGGGNIPVLRDGSPGTAP